MDLYKGDRNWRSRVIHETNLRTSYAARRWEQSQAVKQALPYWQYETGRPGCFNEAAASLLRKTA